MKASETKKKYVLKNNKVDGKRIKSVWIRSSSLNGGRYYGAYSDDSDDADNSDGPEWNMPLKLLKANQNIQPNEDMMEPDGEPLRNQQSDMDQAETNSESVENEPEESFELEMEPPLHGTFMRSFLIRFH